ncbi:MAG: ubiquinone/menaquinone biosynthesis C-methylase UbiE [Granulosicoccus sp.]|jgi:ubiquinone/menaquinone biosynthesis C-methylase UbiE
MAQTTQDLGITRDIDVIDRVLCVENKFLVDAGCGDMGLSRALAKRGARVLGIDPDPIQAEKNIQADIIPNVGFAHTGAQSIPVENASVDGVLFPYSLHHVPADMYQSVFSELSRILKPDGFIYAMEPVASGKINEVMRIFHDEAEVREMAQTALDELAIPLFEDVSVFTYCVPVQYESWEDFKEKYIGASYNTASYTPEQVSDDSVKAQFLSLGEATGFMFESPMKVTFLRGLKAL